MAYTHLITVAELQELGARGIAHRIFDCSFDLMNPDAARARRSPTAHTRG